MTQAQNTIRTVNTNMSEPARHSNPLSDLSNVARQLTIHSSLRRHGSNASNRSGVVPSPRLTSDMLPPFSSNSDYSSASGSKSASRMATPGLLSRRNSAKEKPLLRQGSVKGKGKEVEHGGSFEEIKSPSSEIGSEVLETAFLNIDRDPETGRKMINQYLVLQELGHGTHGRVRLGRDMSHELSSEDGSEEAPVYYAIKIVDRNPKRKRLASLRKPLGRAEGGKLLNENEIRKEIAIFKKVNHPNVVRMKEIIDAPESSKIFMILEYCEGGELRWKEEDGSPSLTVDETRKIFRDTLLGLEYLHHQGIIHRDIKPSNLLFFGDTVKISDFGCSHYSEALRAHGGDGGYVDDLELAKTAGSPAFFAPEMCYSGSDFETASRGSFSPQQELPGFTLRPPSIAGEVPETKTSRSDPLVLSPTGPTIALQPSVSNDSGLSKRPSTSHARLPITNAIDVWALGVTLYCLLFGRTPFDAPNEYLLMQVIPSADYDVLPTLGADRVPASSSQECLDLLARLLEKDPSKRISLDAAKRHPFTLRGISDPSAWLASTDPNAQTFVTVSSEEVAAVIIKSRIRERVRRGIRSLSNKLLQPLAGRNRSRSIGDGDHPSGQGVEGSENLSRSRRRSVLGFRPNETNNTPVSPLSASPRPVRSFIVNRPSHHLALPEQPPNPTPEPGEPRVMNSSSSLDRLRATPELSPILHRRQSSDIDTSGRQRSSSNASSVNHGISGKLIRMLSRTSSQRSRFKPSSSLDRSPSPQMSLEGLPRKSTEDLMVSNRGVLPSPERLGTGHWEARIKREIPTRRGSNLSEEFTRCVQEEVDWDEPVSDEDEYVDNSPAGLGIDVSCSPGFGEATFDSVSSLAAPFHPISGQRILPSTQARSPQSPLRPAEFDRTQGRAADGPDDLEEEGLAISVGSRRGRRKSILGKDIVQDWRPSSR